MQIEKATNSQLIVQISQCCVWASHLIAVLFWLVSMIMLLAAFDEVRLEDERLLHQPDAIWGVSTRSTLLLAVGFYILTGVFLLLARYPVIKALLMFWVTSICLVYRIGLSWLKPNEPCAIIMLMAHKLCVEPKTVSYLLGFLFIGSLSIGIAMLSMEWLRMKQIRKAMFMERYRQFRERGIR